jgi:hypothetical protein
MTLHDVRLVNVTCLEGHGIKTTLCKLRRIPNQLSLFDEFEVENKACITLATSGRLLLARNVKYQLGKYNKMKNIRRVLANYLS